LDGEFFQIVKCTYIYDGDIKIKVKFHYLSENEIRNIIKGNN